VLVVVHITVVDRSKYVTTCRYDVCTTAAKTTWCKPWVGMGLVTNYERPQNQYTSNYDRFYTHVTLV